MALLIEGQQGCLKLVRLDVSIVLMPGVDHGLRAVDAIVSFGLSLTPLAAPNRTPLSAHQMSAYQLHLLALCQTKRLARDSGVSLTPRCVVSAAAAGWCLEDEAFAEALTRVRPIHHLSRRGQAGCSGD